MKHIKRPLGLRLGTVLIDRNIHVDGALHVVGGFIVPGEQPTALAGEQRVWELGPREASRGVVTAAAADYFPSSGQFDQ